MAPPLILRVYLYPPMLYLAQAGKLGFLNRIRALLAPRGWQIVVQWSGDEARRRAPDLPGYALYHMERPTHPAALTFRRAYHYPYWRLETVPERWRWPVAHARFDPDSLDDRTSRDFMRRLAARVLPGPEPQRGDHVLIALQGRIADHRSFQTCSPLAMVRAVARTGRPAAATLHPKEIYSPADRAALEGLAARHPNLTIGGDTGALLRDCAYVVTQNSAVAFDGYILGKPAVLFGQSDFHHIALKVISLGAPEALRQAADHQPPVARYLDWFLRGHSLDMMADDADPRLLAAMKKGGWPV